MNGELCESSYSRNNAKESACRIRLALPMSREQLFVNFVLFLSYFLLVTSGGFAGEVNITDTYTASEELLREHY